MPYIRRRIPKLEEFPDLDKMDVIVKKKPDPKKQKVHCVYCKSRMILLKTSDVQWMCESCGAIAREGHGDTPVRDTGLRGLATPNNPFPTEIDTRAKTIVKDLPEWSEDDDRPEVGTLPRDRYRRTGLQWYNRGRIVKTTDIREVNKLI